MNISELYYGNYNSLTELEKQIQTKKDTIIHDHLMNVITDQEIKILLSKHFIACLVFINAARTGNNHISTKGYDEYHPDYDLTYFKDKIPEALYIFLQDNIEETSASEYFDCTFHIEINNKPVHVPLMSYDIEAIGDYNFEESYNVDAKYLYFAKRLEKVLFKHLNEILEVAYAEDIFGIVRDSSRLYNLKNNMKDDFPGEYNNCYDRAFYLYDTQTKEEQEEIIKLRRSLVTFFLDNYDKTNNIEAYA